MKHKGKFLIGEHTIEIIVAVLCLIILVYVGFRLYGAATTKNASEKAQAHMDQINEIIKTINNGESKPYFLYSPNDWAIIGWPSLSFDLVSIFGPTTSRPGNIQQYSEKDIPKTCSDKGWSRCLCICEGIESDAKSNNLASCDFSKICIKIDKELFVGDDGFIQIENGKWLNISLIENKLIIQEEK